MMKEISFFLAMRIPTVTHQEKKATVKNGKIVIYEPQDLKDAREKYMAYLSKHKPEKPFLGPVSLETAWLFPEDSKHEAGEPKTTKPDTDNLIKLFKDCMTKTGFWKDDAQVYKEFTVKAYGKTPGIYVKISGDEL